MAEEKQTPTNIDFDSPDEALSGDDTAMLRAVLHSAHARNIMPVSVYNQADYDSA